MKSNGPRTELFLRSDIACALRAINFANAELSASLPIREVTIYQAGFYAAIQAVSLAFDVDISDAMPQSLLPRQHISSNLLSNGDSAR